MGIIDMITKSCVQTCVYWASPVEDGYGGKTFADPIEIHCRWENKNQWFTDATGNQISSRSIVYVLQHLDEEGVLYLGTLADLDSAEEEDPMTIEDACTIKKFESSPVLGSTTQFAYKAWLTPLLT
jgi:hypothetical protein